MPKKHSPRRGSLEYKRKRADKELPTVSNWPKATDPVLLGIPAYKTGMVTLYTQVQIKNRYREVFGREKTLAATVLEVPPVRPLAIRTYKETPYGKKTFRDVWTPTFSRFEKKYLNKRITLPNDYTESNMQSEIDEVSAALDEIDDIRIIVRTMPEQTGISQKVPELIEMGVGGDIEDSFEFALEHLGEKINVTDVFSKGKLVDSIGVTKGQGFQGVVKRFGVRLLPPKTKKGTRKVAAMGAWHPARTSWRVPQAGQTGFHKRTEHNKQILEILDKDDAKELNPSGGWKHYGVLQQPALIVKGSVQGPQKRTLVLRKAIRPTETEDLEVQSVWYSDEELMEF